jgi:hypothetical protein
MAPDCRILGFVTVEKPTRAKRRRPAAVETDERIRRTTEPVRASVDADARRRARERAGSDD